jgi:hypothetical protein
MLNYRQMPKTKRRTASNTLPIRVVDWGNYTHQTGPTQFVEAAGIRFAFRRFGANLTPSALLHSLLSEPWITGIPAD